MTPITTVVVSRDTGDALIRSLSRHPEPVILVHNAPSEGVISQVRHEHPEITVIPLAHDHGVEAFNVGVKAARTRYVALCDDSSWWGAESLANAAQVFDRNPTVGLIAGVPCREGDHVCDPLAIGLSQSRPGTSDDLPGASVLGFVDCFCVVRRQPFLDQGGFDSVAGWGGLEQRIALDMIDAGWGVRFITTVIVWQKEHHWQRVRRIRDDVMTAFLRRPLRVAMDRAGEHLRRGPAGLWAVCRVVVDAPRAMVKRRSLSARAERKAQKLESGPTLRWVYHLT